MCRVTKYEMVAEKVASYNTDLISQRMNDSESIAKFIMTVLKSDSYTVEHMMVFMLDSKLKIMGFSDVSKGILDASFVHPREVFIPAIATPKTACVIVAHNHPSGDPTPSVEDKDVTKRLKDAGEILGIRLLDHIVVGDGRWVSLKAEGIL